MSRFSYIQWKLRDQGVVRLISSSPSMLKPEETTRRLPNLVSGHYVAQANALVFLQKAQISFIPVIHCLDTSPRLYALAQVCKLDKKSRISEASLNNAIGRDDGSTVHILGFYSKKGLLEQVTVRRVLAH